MTLRLTARGRLAVLYTAVVLGAGAVLTALTYVLVQRSLENQWIVIKTDPSMVPTPVPVNSQAISSIAEQVRSQTLSEMLTQSAIALAIVTVLAAVLGWVIAGRILKPIRAVAATAQRLSAEDLSERVPVTTPADELAALATTINAMLDRIQTGVTDRDRLLESHRMFVANAAHELRTPLTTMRTAIDVTFDGQPTADEMGTMVADLGAAIERSQRTLDGLLALARSQTGPSKRLPVNLASLVADAVTGIRALAAARNIKLHTDLRNAPTAGEPALLERMAVNLIDNSLRHNHTDGHITVKTGAAEAQVYLQVANTGQPIPPNDVEDLFNPFVRGDVSGARDGGVGLGLSIVRAIVTAHDGHISGSARPAGGLVITVSLPIDHSGEQR
ncbi:sensor histidine kinase [Catelliglobosispora koreensis]|uniref:sensor histidine kinase n=1 Tax=Catelliglobosispora koreensis TaxID=129052 RepID=UPI000378DE2D|nr:HAMP domain-containing sensor histidine kinase [Catelliglobosispora koreensis]